MNRKKVCLFVSGTYRSHPDLWVGERRFPHGTGFLASTLISAGHDVVLCDRFVDPDRFPEDIRRFDFFGVTLSTPLIRDGQYIVNRILAAKRQDAPIAVGGPHCSLFSDRIPDGVDFVVQGEGEKVINGLVEGEHDSGTTIATPRLTQAELDTVEYPWRLYLESRNRYHMWNPFDTIEPVFNLNTSRGCPFRCSFCGVSAIWGRQIVYMSHDRVISDIKEIVSKYGARGVYFREDLFTGNRRRVRQLCERLIETGLHRQVTWYCESRADAVRLLPIMYEAGCRGLYVGFETGSPHMLAVFKKDLKIETMDEFAEEANRLGIHMAASLIHGHPEETEEDVVLTRRFLERHKFRHVWWNQYRHDLDWY